MKQIKASSLHMNIYYLIILINQYIKIVNVVLKAYNILIIILIGRPFIWTLK